jgi:hypothetical protein
MCSEPNLASRLIFYFRFSPLASFSSVSLHSIVVRAENSLRFASDRGAEKKVVKLLRRRTASSFAQLFLQLLGRANLRSQTKQFSFNSLPQLFHKFRN